MTVLHFLEESSNQRDSCSFLFSPIVAAKAKAVAQEEAAAAKKAAAEKAAAAKEEGTKLS